MLNKHEHITFWKNTAAKDWKAVYDVGIFSKILIKYPNLLIQARTYNPKQFSNEIDPLVDEIINTGIEIKV